METKKIVIKVLSWMASSIIYIFSAWYIIFILPSQDSKLYLLLLVWMVVSGFKLLHEAYKTFCDVFEVEN